MWKQILVLLFLSILSCTSESVSEPLEVIVTKTKLPFPRRFTSTGYDGEDSIYLWGENLLNVDLDILKYSISNQTIKKIGTMLRNYHNSGCWIGNNNFIHIGGQIANTGTLRSDVWNFDTTNPSNWTSVANLTNGLAHSSIIWDEGENIYTFGGVERCVGCDSTKVILKYSTTTQIVVNAGVLPKPVKNSASVWDSSSGSAYIFGGEYMGGSKRYSKDILKFDAVEERVRILNVTLPVGISFASAVWNGKEAYIIGGTAGLSVTPPPLVRFNPSTKEVANVSVNNFPYRLIGSGCVFVKKLNRIYIFGGRDEDGYRDQIMYIDLYDNDTPATTTEALTTEAFTTTEAITISTDTPTTEAITISTDAPTTEAPSTVTTTNMATTTEAATTEAITTEATTRHDRTTVVLTTPGNPATTTTTTTGRPVDFECPTRFGFYADPKNCRGFYECRFSIPYHYCCPLPLFYNPTNERCDFQYMVECHHDPGLPCHSPIPYTTTTTTSRWPVDTSQYDFEFVWYIIIGTAAVIITALVIYCHVRGKYHHCRKLQKDKVEDEVRVTRPQTLQQQHDPLPTAPPQSYFENPNRLEFNQNRQLRGPFTPNQNFGSPARPTITRTDHRPVEGVREFEEPPPPYSSVMNM